MSEEDGYVRTGRESTQKRPGSVATEIALTACSAVTMRGSLLSWISIPYARSKIKDPAKLEHLYLVTIRTVKSFQREAGPTV